MLLGCLYKCNSWSNIFIINNYNTLWCNHLPSISSNCMLPAADNTGHYVPSQTFKTGICLVWDVKVMLASQSSSSFNDFTTLVVAIFSDSDASTKTSEMSRQSKLKLLLLSDLKISNSCKFSHKWRNLFEFSQVGKFFFMTDIPRKFYVMLLVYIIHGWWPLCHPLLFVKISNFR